MLALLYLRVGDKGVDELAAKIDRMMANLAIDSPLRQAHFLAQIGHESGELRFREEIASGEAYERRGEIPSPAASTAGLTGWKTGAAYAGVPNPCSAPDVAAARLARRVMRRQINPHNQNARRADQKCQQPVQDIVVTEVDQRVNHP